MHSFWCSNCRQLPSAEFLEQEAVFLTAQIHAWHPSCNSILYHHWSEPAIWFLDFLDRGSDIIIGHFFYIFVSLNVLLECKSNFNTAGKATPFVDLSYTWLTMVVYIYKCQDTIPFSHNSYISLSKVPFSQNWCL